jgi:cytochrome c oxidase assembly protein subunit 11
MLSEEIRAARTRQTVKRAVIACSGAFAFCFAMIPLYQIYCEITGANGKTGQIAAAAAGQVDTSRLIKVQFDGAVHSGLTWAFQPLQRTLSVHPGQVIEARFVARNYGAVSVVGKAVPSVAPGEASLYFNKTECFCFTQQRLDPGQSMELPVRFVVDPAIPTNVHVLTLSYTFFSDDVATAALAQHSVSPDNAGS